ncbi:hypothetical protein V6N12_003991 [Hibiscus sabdariffa]|uniref:Uncharacterized protein n=1 Tax=Hibiscus sabdariffa TaxID=183260 RepID=A0ABR2CLX7_9ROSI
MQFSQQLHLLNSIMLHCINLKIMSHLVKPYVNSSSVPKLVFLSDFRVMFISNYVPCFLRSINEFERKRKRFNISSKSSKLLDELVSHSHGISHTLCPCSL